MSNSGQSAQQQALAQRANALRQRLQGCKPVLLAVLTGSTFEMGAFHLRLFQQPLRISFPDFQVRDASTDKPLPTFMQAMLLYYFTTSDGASLAGKWVSFADLPGGRMYAQAFQGYSGDEVVKAFGLDVDAFIRTGESCGGSRLDLGEAAFQFQALPRLPLVVTYWPGDDDFPSTSKILFDASACHYLPIDACAILGGMLARKLVARKV